MKVLFLAIALFPLLNYGQFDYYGPESFDQILNRPYTQSWTPSTISSIENRKYVVILDQATQSKAVMLNSMDNEVIEFNSIDSLASSNATYGSMMRSIFQLVDANTHECNDAAGSSGAYYPLSGEYKVNPLLHSYYALNSDATDEAISADGGTYYIHEATNSGYLLIEFGSDPNSTTISAVSQWEYSSALDSVIEVTGWTTKYLMFSGSSLSWTTNSGSASLFTLADATDLLDIEIANGSDFNPVNVTYQLNATIEIPEMDSMENSMIVVNLPNDVDAAYLSQFGNSASASTAASAMLSTIEADLISNGDSLRYPMQFYLDVRENMLSQKVASTDVFNVRLGNNSVEHVYFTNATDDSGVPHPFMVIASHATSTRPNMLLDVNRPPGGSGGPGYAESQVTRYGKLGEFLVKIPLKDYGLIDSLLQNDLSPYGDLASDFDAIMGTTTTPDVYNYTGLASCGMAVDGVTIYPAYNNNLRFAVEDGEVTSSGIHVGGGLELHYHADGHAFTGNGINLYNLADYAGHDHPPVIGMSYDGIALFGRYESSFSSMAGYNVPLDENGGHDHGDGFGYHYHAHTETVTASTGSTNFDEHFLLVGAWKGNINDIPGFDEVKTNQLMDPDIGRYVGASYSLGISEPKKKLDVNVFPNPSYGIITIEVEEQMLLTIYDLNGRLIETHKLNVGMNTINLKEYGAGVYLIQGSNENGTFVKNVVIK